MDLPIDYLSTNLDGFNLANYGRFAEFPPPQTFPLYGIFKEISKNFPNPDLNLRFNTRQSIILPPESPA